MRSGAKKVSTHDVAETAKEALRTLSAADERSDGRRVRVRPVDAIAEASVVLPDEAFQILLETLRQLADGNAVTVVPIRSELTTHQAAELLNVSRPYLIELLDAGKIPFRKVGTHRRIRFADLMTYKRIDDAARDAAAAELTRQAEELGLGY